MPNPCTDGAAKAGAPFPQWAFVLGSPGQRVNKVDNATMKATVEAISFPSRVLFFTSQATAQECANSHGGSKTLPGTGGALNQANNALNAATGAVQCAGGIVVGKFNVCVDLEHWFIRIGEILLGLVLVGVGIARITGVQNVVSNIAKTKLLPI
jgi:hypothetical protein